ncbi:MAG: Diphthamide biosynthesis protein 4 [Chrysothrix sp. TS-e1954]|nr:MAG: Diphthamide biosynthesis protein 4 [Chrysothrix sp. TS-e1954]
MRNSGIESIKEDHGQCTADHYEVLGLDKRDVDALVVKAAYRSALLKHHPDKTKGLNRNAQQLRPSNVSRYSIDQITEAFTILSDYRSKQHYDGLLALAGRREDGGMPVSGVTTELEDVDLDDMTYSEATKAWTMVCRCGNECAFELSEEDLMQEANAGLGEIFAYCADCSHHIRVAFDVEESKYDSNGQIVS